MDELEAFLALICRRRPGRYWLGARPDVRPARLLAEIAWQLGYPTSGETVTAKPPPLERAAAAEALAYIAAESLVFRSGKGPRPGLVERAVAALADLDESAAFFASGDGRPWSATGGRVGGRLSDATFEAGVIGYDRTRAFIVWVEEED